jgi:hypothetical protein
VRWSDIYIIHGRSGTDRWECETQGMENNVGRLGDDRRLDDVKRANDDRKSDDDRISNS